MSRGFARSAPRRAPAPLDAAALESFALRYVGRYATTRGRLADYLKRKLVQRGWSGEDEPPVADIVARLNDLGYVDDQAFAAARGRSLGQRGYGERRVAQALRAAGIEEEEAVGAREAAREGALAAALAFARRRKVGPFAAVALDREQRHKALAAMLRAGHALDLARRILSAAPGATLEPD